MSGSSGSGKNTYIKNNYTNCKVVSADDFFETSIGYVFNHNLLGKAHAQCFRNFISFLLENTPLIIVNNTNTSVIEIAPYVAAANAFEATIELITLIKDPAICAARNVHNVPLSTINRMEQSIKNRTLPKHWNFTSIKTITQD
jgi:predicted kinase